MSESAVTHMIFVKVNVEIRSEANLREHWRTRHQRTKLHHEAVQWALMRHKPPKNPSALKVIFTRVGGRRLDPDNNVGGFKHVQDALARWVGVDDRDSRWTFVHNQRAQPKERYAEVTLTWEERE